MPPLVVTLARSGQQHVRARHPQLPFSDLVAPAGLEPGRPVRLHDEDGEVVGAGIADPENELIRVWAHGADAPAAFDAAFLRDRLRAALALRRRLGLADGRSAYRLVNAEGDGLPGLTMDVYGAFAVVTAPARGLLPYARTLAQVAPAVLDEAGLRLQGSVVKARLPSTGARPERSKDEIVGEAPPDKLVVEELGVPYEVHLTGGLNVGLFTDMREHRRGLARFVAGRRVLNTFAYTGALSVAAARAGAAAVTSVDLAAGPLAWARENFRLSGFAPDDARFGFEVADVLKFLEGEQQRRARWDVIILDPPTVSGARVGSWAQKRDYPALIALAASLLPDEGGHLWISTNTHKGPPVLKYAEEGLRLARRHGAVLETGGLPPDYPTPVAWPAARYLDVCQMWVV